MNKYLIGAIAFLFIAFPIVALWLTHYFIVPINTKDFVAFYQTSYRASLFSGFLTLGGFLFSLKTFIIIKMKENVYDNDDYKKIHKKRSGINSSITYYGPLKRLGLLLFLTVLFSVLTAVMQFTVGVINNWFAAAVCIGTALFTCSLIFFSLIEVKINLHHWFEMLEESQNKS